MKVRLIPLSRTRKQVTLGVDRVVRVHHIAIRQIAIPTIEALVSFSSSAFLEEV